jgi:hypothetical protein
MYYLTAEFACLRSDLLAAGFTVTLLPLAALGTRRDGTLRCGLLLARKPT